LNKETQERAATGKAGGTFREIAELAKTMVWAAVIALVVRTFFYEPFNIPSGSMMPTLLVGDYLFVSKSAYGYGRYSFPFGLTSFAGRIWSGAPQRGDVVVFRPPGEPETDFIKRVIGLPGDRVQMKAGLLYINGQPVERRQIEDYADPDNRFSGPVAQYVESLPGGVQHRIIEISGDQGDLDNTPVYVVPDEHYFMMGDNRDGSNDSRPWDRSTGVGIDGEIGAANADVLQKVGFVPLGNLVGPAKILFWSYGPDFRWYNPFSWVTALRFGRLLDLVE
jgi:signal peptidase I